MTHIHLEIQEDVSVIELNSLGLQGPEGPQGPPGTVGSLGDLGDVSLTSPISNNALLSYNSSLENWQDTNLICRHLDMN
jgi:hypothetical protein